MGYYVNPGENQAAWLERNAKEFPNKEAAQAALGAGEMIVVWMDNGPFAAAGVAVDERELDAFTESRDTRPKRFFVAAIDVLLPVTQPSLQKFVDKALDDMF